MQLKRFIPMRIATQIFVLMLLSVGVVHLMMMVHFRLLEEHRDTSSGVVQAASLLRMFAEATDEPERAVVRSIAERRGVAFIFGAMDADVSRDDHGVPVPFPFLRHAFGAMQVQEKGEELVLGYPLRDGRMVSTVVPRPEPPFPRVPVPLVFMVVLTVVFTLWAVRWLTAPLDKLAKAADAFGHGGHEEQPVLLKEQGPSEIIRVSKAFNAMRLRIGQLLEQRSRMLTAISHDMRTPLTRLRLRAEKVDDETLRARLVDDIERIDLLLHDTLEYFRTGRQVFLPERHNLGEMLRTLVAEYHDPDVRYEGAHDLWAECEDASIWRAVSNVVDNALRYAGNATVVLYNEQNMVRITVSDTGKGLSDTLKSQVMEPFLRGDAARGQGKKDGFGLGLSIVQNIITLHGGTVSLRDNIPHGLVVEMCIPAIAQEKPISA